MKENTNTSGNARTTVAILVLVGAVVIAGIAVYIATREIETKPIGVDQPTNGGGLSGAEVAIGAAGEMMKSRKFSNALELLRKYVKANPKEIRTRVMLADCCEKLGKVDEALMHADVALELNPDYPGALWIKGMCLNRKQAGEGLNYFRKAAESPEAGVLIWSWYGLLMLNEGNSKEARKYLTKARDKGTQHGNVYAGLGKLEFDDGKFDGALSLFNKAIKMSGEDRVNPRVWDFMAMIYNMRDESDRELDCLLKAEKRNRGLPRIDILRRLGDTYSMRRSWAEAAGAYANASRLLRGLRFARGSDYDPGKMALESAKCWFFANKPEGNELGLAMEQIDIASTLLPQDKEVLEWKKKIEDARYGSPKRSNKKNELPPLDFDLKLK